MKFAYPGAWFRISDNITPPHPPPHNLVWKESKWANFRKRSTWRNQEGARSVQGPSHLTGQFLVAECYWKSTWHLWIHFHEDLWSYKLEKRKLDEFSDESHLSGHLPCNTSHPMCKVFWIWVWKAVPAIWSWKESGPPDFLHGHLELRKFKNNNKSP